MCEPTYDEIMQDKDLAFSEAVKARVIPPQKVGKTTMTKTKATFATTAIMTLLAAVIFFVWKFGNGIASMQTFLESLVLAWLAQSESSTTWAEKGESAAGGDDTDSAYRKNNLASNSTAKEADLSSVQNVPLP